MQKFGLLRGRAAAVAREELAKRGVQKTARDAFNRTVEATPRGEILDSAFLRFRQRVETIISEDGFGVLIGARPAKDHVQAAAIKAKGFKIGEVCLATDILLREECKGMAPISRSGGMRGHHRGVLMSIDRFLGSDPPEKDNENPSSPMLMKWGAGVIDLLEALEHCMELDAARKPANRRKGGENGQGIRKRQVRTVDVVGLKPSAVAEPAEA